MVSEIVKFLHKTKYHDKEINPVEIIVTASTFDKKIDSISERFSEATLNTKLKVQSAIDTLRTNLIYNIESSNPIEDKIEVSEVSPEIQSKIDSFSIPIGTVEYTHIIDSKTNAITLK